MTAKLTASLRRAPETVPALLALALFVIWATSQAGYPLTHWAPGGVILLGLLAGTAVAARPRLAALPGAVRLALACLALYTAFSFLSILWAEVPGSAWEGADRTLLYLIVFALFACWGQQGTTAAVLLIVWTLALAGLGVFMLLHLDSAGAGGLQAMVPDGRLAYPSGYPNANAAQWLMAFWPALLLLRSPRLFWWLRGLLAAAAVLLAEVALLSQSRGSLYATPVMLVLVFALLPGRVRTFLVMIPIGAAIAAAAPAVLHVGDRLRDDRVVPATLHAASRASLIAALVAGIVVALGAFAEGRARPSAAAASRLHRGLGAVAIAGLVAAVAAGLVAAGNPITRLEHGWHEFKRGYSANSQTSDRLVSGLGSGRYDFYRVALDEFKAHPLAGIGADNFQQQYLRHGRTEETPRYPHSIEMRTLVETGVIGALIALAGLGGALLSAWRALRSQERLAAEVAAAALAGFGYWVVHGSFDWFFEFAGLGAPAFALLGLTCALDPGRARVVPGTTDVPAAGLELSAQEDAIAGEPARRSSVGAPPAPQNGWSGRLPLRRAGWGLGALAGAACAVSLVLPWLSQLQLQRAAGIWEQHPRQAYARLRDASELNPLSDQAYTVAGSIALRYGQLARAEHYFQQALGRDHGDSYASLELGAIASARGQQARALQLLERAVALSPREGVAREALAVARSGRRLSLEALNRSILVKAQQL